MSNNVDAKDMTQAIQCELMPKLRFPEFRDAPEWETKQLGELLLGHPEYGVNAAAVTYSEDLPAYLRITDISEEGYFLCGKKASVAIKATDEHYMSEGDIVLARTGASVGKAYKFRKEDGKLVFAGFLIRIKPDPTKIDSTFLFNFLFTEQYWNWVRVTSARSGQPGINGNEYAALPIPVPPHVRESGGLSEQLKIADCLSSIDELITAQTQKLVTLKTHKKGLMQQLFPAEGETLPKLRFPEFRDDWVIAKLGELGKLSGGGTPDKSVAEYWQGDIPWVSSSDVFEDDIYTMSVTRFINEKSISESATKIVPKGSVLFVSRVGTGKLAVNNIDVCTSQDFTNFLPKKIYNYFLGYFFIANKSALISLGQGTSIKGFSKGDLEQFEVSFPSSLEQKKIADCLSSIDELITAQTHKLATLKTHKKALMQQLFPAFDEVQRWA